MLPVLSEMMAAATARIIRLGLAIDRFLLHAVGFGLGHLLVQFVEFLGDDVLLFVRAEISCSFW